MLADMTINAASLFVRAAVTILLIICFNSHETSWPWVAIIVTFLSAMTETWILRRFFAKRISRRGFVIFCVTNAICVAAVLYRVYAYLIAYPLIAYVSGG
jgi:hypothetical protein